MQSITSRTFLEFQFVSDPRFSPNGKQVAFTVKRPDEKKDGYTGDLYLLENGSVRPLTQEGDAGAYTWTQEGTILFQATRGEDLQRKKAGEVFTSFYEISPNGGQANAKKPAFLRAGFVC
jgi:dipeptidyl aminopeptidase/acylaminoacyl peptidase